MILITLASFFILIAMAFLVWRKHIINYTDPKGLLVQGSYANPERQFEGKLRTVTWNLHYGENLDEVITTLEKTDELENADLLLLQEIDAAGVENIARSLRYNFIYFPSVFSRQRQKEYGNAILAKWPLYNAENIKLPNRFPGWLENRYAAKAVINMEGNDIIVFSVHLDVVWMKPQGFFLTEEIEKQNDPVILGGDFNTWQPSSIKTLEDGLSSIGLERLTRGTGYTFEAYGAMFILDHIFATESLNHTAGVFDQTKASDHYPIWAEIVIESE